MLELSHRTIAGFCVAMLDERCLQAVLARLVELELCTPEELEDPALRQEYRRQLEVAARHGVATPEGYVELVAHRFAFGDDWMERPAVRAILEGEPRGEHALLAALYDALANPAPEDP